MYTFEIESVVKVIDGDTIDVSLDLGFDIMTKQRVRLMGIDTPESRTSDKTEKIYGNMAKQHIKEWCAKIKEGSRGVLKCKERDPRDKYGRVLAELWVGDVNVNQWMIDNHHAVAYHGQNKDDVEAAHLANRSRLGTS